MAPKTPAWAPPVLALLVVSVLAMQARIDPQRHYFRPPTLQPGADISKIPAELFGGALLGFREVAAGLLWVKADDYFHGGRYDDLVPLFYLVTWLDPHQLDVYSTGAWHLAYNLGDQRLIPVGMNFLLSGIQNNPNVYDLYFQAGWMDFNKIRDFKPAVHWFQEAQIRPSVDGTPAPPYIGHMIAHAYAFNGQIRHCVKQWKTNVAVARQKLAKNPTDNDLQQEYDVSVRNLEITNLRLDYFRKEVGKPGYKPDLHAGLNDPRWVKSGDNLPHPIPVNLNFKVVRLKPRVIRIVGTTTLPDFSRPHHENYQRIVVQIKDKDYDRLYAAHESDFPWQKAHLTYYQKIVSYPDEPNTVGRFQATLDFTKDPEDLGHNPLELFPLKSQEYEVTVTYDPTMQGELVMDYTGYKGEGLTDPKNQKLDSRGIRIIQKTVTLTRDQIL